MKSTIRKRAARKVAVGALVGLVSLGLGAVGVAPAHALGTVTVTLAGASEYTSARLSCLDPALLSYSWRDHGTASADNSGTFRFTQAPENAACTVTFFGQSASSSTGALEYPYQTIGGLLSGPDGFSGFELFRTDPSGNASGLVYGLVQAASVTGTLQGVLDAANTDVTLYALRTNLLTQQVVYSTVGWAQPDARTGAFTISDVAPGRAYALSVDSPGYPRTWYGGSTSPLADPYDATISTFTSAGGGAVTPLGVIALAALGASIQGQALGFGASVQVTAINVLTGIGRWAETTTSSYSVNGLTEGVYWVSASGDGARYARGLVAVPAAGAALVNLTGATVQSRRTGATYTAIKGSPEVGAKISAEASTFGSSPGLAISYEYTWITATQILGTGPTLTVPNLAGQELFVVTTIQPAGGAAGYIVSSANGKILQKSGPKFTVKVTGTAQVGKKLKATPAKAVKAKAWKKSYQWLRNGKPIAGKAAKKATYKLTKKDKGKKISVQVTVKRQGYADSAATSKKTAKVK
jgi:hypothetical protein